MKQVVKKLIAVTLAAVMATGMLVGCAGGGNGKNGGGAASNGKTLYIYAQKNGLGDAWLENAAKAYQYETGTEVHVEFDAMLSGNMGTLFENEAAELGDLYFTQGTSWAQYTYNGYIIDLTDFMNEKEDGGKSLAERLQYNNYYMLDDDGNQKRSMVPFTAGVSGFAYNKKMMSYICHDVLGWEEGHEYPGSTKELDEVMDAMEKVAAEGKNEELFTYKQGGQTLHVKPFVWSGTTGAFGGTMETWWNQWNGAEGMVEYFSQEENCDMLNDEGFYVIYQKIMDMLRLEEDSNGDWISAVCIPNCASYNHTAAQTQLLLGKALMCPTGSWFYSEMAASIEDEEAWGFMPYPYMSDDKGAPITRDGVEMPKDEKGKYIPYSRTNVADCFYIPTRAKNPDEAKNFLRFMLSEEYMPTLQTDSQAIMAYSFDNSEVKKSAWFKEVDTFVEKTTVMNTITGGKFQAFGAYGYYFNPYGVPPFSRLAQSGYGSSKVIVDSANGEKISSASAAKGVAVTENVYNYVYKNYLNRVEQWSETVRKIQRY